MKNKVLEKGFKWVFYGASALSIISFVLICYFIFKNGIPFLSKYGLFNFLFEETWNPNIAPEKFGIASMIYGSLIVTLLSAIIGVPLAVFSAIYLSFEVKEKLYEKLKSLIHLMAGVPSIIYGFFALQTLVPFIRDYIGGKGYSILSASILLGVMILPTILAISEASLRQVPRKYYEGSIALGASHSRSILKIVLPAAKSGILAGIILGIGRAIGETMAVVMVVGNQPRITPNILKGIRTMTTNVVLEMAYAAGDHLNALLATGMILFVFILIINILFLIIKKRGIK